MLVSPKESLMVRDLDPSGWKYCTYTEFDGTAEDCFTGTSLHLSFTDYHMPLFLPDSCGQKDSQVSILESVLSIRDHGAWVADIDVLKALTDGSIFRIPSQKLCEHPKNSAPSKPIISVESWDDILDPQDGRLVVKARGNWVARLAAAALLSRSSKRPAGRIAICPPDVCWKCLPQNHDFNIYIY